MFIHRGESFGSTGSVSTPIRKSRVPDLVLDDDGAGYAPLPCIQVTQALDTDEERSEAASGLGPSLGITPPSRRASIGVVGEVSSAPSSGLKARPPGRTSRRVSLIPGEALEQAHAVLDREQLSRRASATSQSLPGGQGGDFPATLEQVLRTSLQQSQQMQLAAAAQSRRGSYKDSCDFDDEQSEDFLGRTRDMRRESTYDGDHSVTSPTRMKSNQRWLKLRTTVQLSGALSSSMNRAKPTLKREDSFIKRFSTRQIPELQDTVDHTDEEDVSKTSTGSPKQRRKRRPRNPISVINPYGSIFFYWLCILTICVLYNLWTAIVREAFPELQTGSQTMWYILDGFTDFTYILDIFIQIRTGYLEQGLIVYDSKKLAAHYLRSKYFLLDLVTVFPLDLVQIYSGMHPMLRFPRFIKVYRVYYYYYMVESRTLYPNFWRVLNLVHILLLLAHWFGCFYYMLSEIEKFEGEWTYPYTYGEEFRTLTRKYLGSVYWSTLTLTTIGDLPTPESDKQMRLQRPKHPQRLALEKLKREQQIEADRQHHINVSSNYTPFEPGPLWDNYTLPFLTFLEENETLIFKEAIQYDSSINTRTNPNQSNNSNNWTSFATDKQYREPMLLVSNHKPFPNVTQPSSNISYGNVPDQLSGMRSNKTNNSVALDFFTMVLEPEDHPNFMSKISKREVFAQQSETKSRIWRTDQEQRAPSKINKSRRDYRSRLLHIRTNKGYIFTITSYLIGVFIFATIVGQVGNVITNRNANRLEFERLLDGAKLYMRHHKVPREMQRRVQRWYDYSWSRRGRIQGGGDINSALGLLPDKLRTELALHVNLSTLKKVSIFKECQPEFLHDLVLKMKAYIFTPGDLICRKGEVAREMFIIADGILEVISELGKVLTTMKAGDFFGEIGILNLDGLNKRTADVRSVGYSELFSLSREDVLTAMKDYPEAQEILQSLGHKRLKEARHPISKPASVTSSKRGSLTPNRDSSGDEHRQSKKIVSRLKSDVSAIRNAFRRGKAVTRDFDGMELEPLTPERGSIDDDAPAVRRILKLPRQMTLAAKRAAFRKLKRDTGSGSSDSGGGSRGVLKRMPHVSDDSQQSALGAGLPLLQRLKLLKEKEEREEKQKQDCNSRRRKSQRGSRSPRDTSPSKQPITQDEEPEVIGAGLPLFARLKLLKAKEDKEREERELKEKFVNERGNIVEKNDAQSSSSEVYSSKDEDSKRTSSRTGSSEVQTFNEPLKNRLKSVFQSSISKKSATSSTSSQDDRINDLNKGTKNSREGGLELPSNNNTIIIKETSKNSSKSPITRAFNRISKKLNVPDNKTPTSCDTSAQLEATTKEPPEDINKLTVEEGTNKEKIQRSESFKKAMDEDLMDNSEDQELNIHVSESDSSMDDNKVEQINENVKSDSDTKIPENKDIEDINESNKDSKSVDKISPVHQDLIQISSPKKSDPSLEDINLKSSNSTLKVSCYEESQPISSSPESTETSERKTLKSILKRISTEDSDSILLRSGGVNLKSLMRAQTVEGFFARRSKLSKSIFFQRKTLSSPPHLILSEPPESSTTKIPSTQSQYISPIKGSSTQEKKPTTDGVHKLLSKLGTIGVDSEQHSHAEDLVRGVRKILRDKIEDVEVAWEAKIDTLQQEVALRDATIQHLTETIVRLQHNGHVLDVKEGKRNSKGSIERLDGKIEASGQRRVLRVQLSEASNPSSDEEEECLFMRCNSIDSIIHQSPEASPVNETLPPIKPMRTWSRPQMRRQVSISHTRGINSWENDDRRQDVIIDVDESSTDDDLFSYSSEDDHVIFGSISEAVEDETEDEVRDNLSELQGNFEDFGTLSAAERGEVREPQQLNSQDWEVQMLANQLAQDQRGVARIIDRDIASGRLQSPLADLHEALATDNLNTLTELDLVRLEKIVRKEREKLRQYARMYSLDERPVLEDEFSSLYRSRSQLLLSKSSELCRAGPTERRLSTLLKQLTTLPSSEQFLLDRLVYKSSKNRRFNRQQSLCDERLLSCDESRSMRLTSRSSAALRRSLSMCSPPPDSQPFIRQSSVMNDDQEDPFDDQENPPLVDHNSATVSAMLVSIQKSVGNLSNRRDSTPNADSPLPKENQTLVRPQQR